MPTDDNNRVSYNSMQQQVGLLPPSFSAPNIFPSQVSAMASMPFMGGGGNMFQSFTNQNPFIQGNSGVMMPLMPSAQINPYGPGNPYASMPSYSANPPNLYTPYAPAPPPVYGGAPTPFQNPYSFGLENSQYQADQRFMSAASSAGIGARVGTNMAMGGMGAAVGARYGGRYGAIAGAAMGFLGSEYMGFGQMGQNAFENYVAGPQISARAATASIEEMSQRFIVGGPNLHARGQGFTHGAAHQVASGIEGLANSTFNRQDMFKITQMAGDEGMLSGIGSPQQMVGRVKEVAQSLQSFMQLANEPDIQRAIKTMGELRNSGLNLSETMQAVANGRTYARMAGQSFQEMSAIGGAQGSQTFQSMGLSQGLGYQVGMQNYGFARGSQLGGTLGSGIMSLAGGAQGLANMNNMFSAGMLQMPMLAPGLMSASGGLSASAINGAMTGQHDLFSMTSRGANVLGQMTGRMGVEGLGMAIGMQPLLQDAAGRLIQSQGPFAQRQMEDSQIMALSRQMGMRGSAGFMTAAQAMGMSGTQATARAAELSDPNFFNRQRQQIRVRAQEEAATERQQIIDRAPGVLDEISETNASVYGARRAYAGVERTISHALHGLTGGGADRFYSPTTSWEQRQMRNVSLTDLQLPQAARRTRGEHLADIMSIGEGEGFTGVGSVLYGAINSRQSRRDTDRDLRAAEQDRRVSAGIRNSTISEITSAQRNDPFGGNLTARTEFATSVANLYNNPQRGGGLGATERAGVNALFRGAVMALTPIGYDPGNILGNREVSTSQIRDEYIRTRTAQGISREEATREFTNNQTQILNSASGSIRGQLTDSGRAQLDAQATRGERGAGRGINLEAVEREGYQVFGQGVAGDATSRRTMDRLMGMFGEGFGRNDAQRGASRNYMAAYAALTVQLSDPSKQRAAQQQINRLQERASREGVDFERVMQTVGQRRERGDLGGEDMRHAVEQLGTEDITAEMFQGASAGRTRSRVVQQLSAGFQALGRQEGEIGSLFRGVVKDGRLDSETFRSRLGGLDTERIGQIAQSDPRLGQLLRRYNRASSPAERERIEQDIMRSTVSTAGAEEINQQQSATQMGAWGRYNEGQSRGRGLLSSVLGAISSESFVSQGRINGTRAQREAQRQLGGVDRAEAEAQAAGMGGANDQLLEASRNLNEAARSLNRSATSGALEMLFGRQDAR